ncbi:MAG: hypothetical protein E6G06_20045 [Actinobacteria bacterium]|nr:MAG: hypothetical protein E6G06_20045 [Actinomycetota bacterium]
MSARHPLYRSLLRLYPKDFRTVYGEDLLQHFGDLVTHMGAPAAWARTGIDFVVTVPRYQLETIMTERDSDRALYITLTVFTAGGALSFLAGFGPGIVLLVAAILVAIAQRGTLARSIRTPDASRRRRRLTIAAALAVICAASMVSYARAISRPHVSGTSLILHNAIGVPALIGAIVYLIAGLFTPKAPAAGPGTVSRVL